MVTPLTEVKGGERMEEEQQRLAHREEIERVSDSPCPCCHMVSSQATAHTCTDGEVNTEGGSLCYGDKSYQSRFFRKYMDFQ